MASDVARVLQVVTCDTVGGTEYMVAALAERAARGPVYMPVAFLDRPGPVATRLRAANVPVLSLGRGSVVGASRRLAGLIARERFDVVTAYGFKATVLTRVLVRALSPGTAFVCGVQSLQMTEGEHFDSRKAQFVRAVERHMEPLVDAYDANSQGAFDMLAGLGVPRDKLHLIPNGIDAGAWRRAALAPSTRPLVVCVARLVARKRHVDLLEAVAVLHAEGVALRIVLAGDGPLRGQLAQQADELGIAELVELPGNVEGEALHDLVAAAHVACLVSTSEGTPASVMEAMAAGLPVVGSRVDGIRELVEDGVTGWLVPAGDPASLAGALREVLGDPDLARRMGAAGRARANHAFGLESTVTARLALYRSLMRVR